MNARDHRRSFMMFVRKEFYHILRDRRTLLILFGMPIVLVVLFGFAISNEINDARLAIYDPSRDEVTEAITQRLLASGYFVLVEEVYNPATFTQAFQEGRIKLGIAFDTDFQVKLAQHRQPAVQLIADATDPNTATTLINYASAIINRYQMEANVGKLPYQINTEYKMLYNARLKSVFMFVPGVMTVILMLVSAMMTSIALTREKELGTMEVLLVSPLKPYLVIIGKVVPYVLLAFINTLIILALGTFVFGMPVRGSLALLLAECLLFVLTSLALGILISTRTESQQVAMMISLMVLMLPTILLSGFIFPIESMPAILQWISHIIPARWFIVIVKNIMLKGVGIEFVWKETLILAGMTSFFIIASIRNYKIRLE